MKSSPEAGALHCTVRGDPETADYLKAYKDEKVALERIVKPGPNPSDNPYHYVIVEVDGDKLKVDVIGVDWGSGFQPYPKQLRNPRRLGRIEGAAVVGA